MDFKYGNFAVAPAPAPETLNYDCLIAGCGPDCIADDSNKAAWVLLDMVAARRATQRAHPMLCWIHWVCDHFRIRQSSTHNSTFPII